MIKEEIERLERELINLDKTKLGAFIVENHIKDKIKLLKKCLASEEAKKKAFMKNFRKDMGRFYAVWNESFDWKEELIKIFGEVEDE